MRLWNKWGKVSLSLRDEMPSLKLKSLLLQLLFYKCCGTFVLFWSTGVLILLKYRRDVLHLKFYIHTIFSIFTYILWQKYTQGWWRSSSRKIHYNKIQVCGGCKWTKRKGNKYKISIIKELVHIFLNSLLLVANFYVIYIIF